MKWWEIPQNCSCVFSIDYDSPVTPDKILFTNNNLRHLKSINGDNLAYKASTSGLIVNNFKIKGTSPLITYKCLYINGNQYLFDAPITLPNNFTIVLKCKVDKSSLLMSNNASNYGLTFGTGEYAANDDLRWRVQGFNTGADYPESVIRSAPKDTVDTVILRGDISKKEVEFITNYGRYTIPQDSSAFTGYVQNIQFTTMGYSHSGTNWRPTLGVIAYGVFDKIIQDIELDALLSQVDSQFLEHTATVKQKSLNALSILDTDFLPKLPLKSSPTLITSLGFNRFSNKINTGILSEYTRSTRFSMEACNILYKSLEQIVDIVLEEGQPVQTTLYLYERRTGVLLKTTYSNKRGEFLFKDLNKDFEYLVTASDPKYQFQSILKNYNN